VVPPIQGEEIGSVSTRFNLLGPNDKIVIEAVDDPEVSGVTYFLSRAKTWGISGAVGVAEDTSDASIACRQMGPVSLPEAVRSGKSDGIVCAVEKISEHYLIPILEQLLEQFSFELLGFHANNGSEYINKRVAHWLQKLWIEFTKSRSRHSNDNARIESKNGAIIRKHLGYLPIPQKWAPLINDFYRDHFNPYINDHRPCFFPVVITNPEN
jgi:hypothetical protein